MERTFESGERICRLCLGTLGYFVNIFDNRLEMDNLATKIMRCAAIEVKKSDGLPDSACHRCVAKVESSYEFRLLCESSDAKLRRLLLPKILDEEKYDVERQQKQVLNCEISQQTLDETSSKEITILFVSTKRTSASRGNATKISEVTGSTSESKRIKSISSTSKPRFSPETHPNHQPIQENVTEDIPVPQRYSASNQQIHIDINHSDQCQENATEECGRHHFNADHNSIRNDSLQVKYSQEKLSNECYSFSSPFESVPETNAIETHQKQIRTRVIMNQPVIQSKESMPNWFTDSEVLTEDRQANPIIDTNVMLTAEKKSSLVLKCCEDAQMKRYETANSLTSSEHLYSEMRNIKNDDSSMESGSFILPFGSSYSDQQEAVLDSDSSNSSKLILQRIDSVNNIDLPQCQSNIKSPLKLLPHSRHASTENAAEALIMLSNSVENNPSLPHNSIEPSTLSTLTLTNKKMRAENLERTSESNKNDLFDTCLTTTLSLIQVEKKSLHSVEKDTKSDTGSKRSEENLTNESINVKIKCISGKYTIEKVRDYQVDASACTTANRTDTTSGDTHARIASEGTRETKSIKKDKQYTTNRVSAKLDQDLVSSIQRRKTIESLSRNDTPSEETTDNTDLSSYSASLTESVAKSQSSESQYLKENIDSSESTTYNSNLLQATHKEMLVQQKISTDFSETPGEVEVTGTEFHADAFWLLKGGVGRNNLSEQRENAGNISENVENELHFSKAESGGKPINVKKMCKRSGGKRGYSKITKKSRTRRSEVEVTSTESHTDTFRLVNGGVGRNNLSKQSDNTGNTSENLESELYFSKADSDGKPTNVEKMCKLSYGKRCYSNRKKKSCAKSKFKPCNSHMTLTHNQQLTEINSKITSHGASKEDAASCEYTTDNTKTTDICNVANKPRNNLLQATPKEMPVEQMISTDLSDTPGEVEVTSTEFHADAFRLVNGGVRVNNLSIQRENIADVSVNGESELHFSKSDSDGKLIDKKKMCRRSQGKRGYSNRKKKSRIKCKFKQYDSHVSLTDNQHPNENNSKVTCHEVINRKLPVSGEIKTVKQPSNNEIFSAPKDNAIFCGDRTTKTVRCAKFSFPKELKGLPRQSETDISKEETQNDGIYGVPVNCATNHYEGGHAFTNMSPANSNTKTNYETELPLKDLRVLLVRLEIDANGHCLNADKRVNIRSIQSSELRLQRQSSISNNPKQNVLSSSSSAEDSTKKQTLHIRSCGQKSNILEEFGRASTKVSQKRHEKARHKRTIKTAKKHDQTSKILTSSPAPNSLVLNSSDLNVSCVKSHKNKIKTHSPKIEEDEDSSRSVDDSNKERVRWKPPKITLENTPNGSVETLKARRIVGKWQEAANHNTIAISRCKVKSPFDNMEETEKSEQHCSKFSKGKLVTSNLSVDSGKKTSNPKVPRDPSCNFNGKMKPSDNYKAASNNINANPTNVYFERNFVHSSKRREESAVNNANKKVLKEISSAHLKICEQDNKVNNNYQPFTPSGINNSKKMDIGRNYDCIRGNMELGKCGNASSIRENNNIENISQPTCREKFRNSRKLTIENYRKLRQSELRNSSKLNTSNNNKHDVNIVQAYTSCFKARASHSESANTMLRHAGTKVDISPRFESFYMNQRELCINSSLNHSNDSRHTTSELWKHNVTKESWRVPRNFLNEKYKRSYSWCPEFQKEKGNKSQQVLQSANHRPTEYKNVFKNCKSMINCMRTPHQHDGEDDEQCKMIRKEIFKSAYMSPQLAVLTADSPGQSSIWLEEKHPETESVLNIVTNVYRSPVSSDLRDSECTENVAPSNLHEDEHQVKHQNKNEGVQMNNNKRLEMKIGISHLDMKQCDDPSSSATLSSKPVTNEKIGVKSHEVESNNDITPNAQHSKEGSKEPSKKSVTSSCNLEEQLNKRKYDTVNLPKSIHCTTGVVSLPSPRRENETKRVNLSAEQEHKKHSYFVENLSTTFPRDVHYYDNAKPIENGGINAKSKIANSSAMYDSLIKPNLLEIQDEPNLLNFRSSREEEFDATFKSGAKLQNIFGDVIPVDNSAEYKPRKGLKRKHESDEDKIVRISEQNKSSSIETTVQTESLIEKKMCDSKALEQECSDVSLKEKKSCKYITQDVKELTVQLSTEISTLQQSSEIRNPAPLPFAEGKTCKTVSSTLDVVINKGEPACSADKKKSGVFDPRFELSSVEDTDFVPEYELLDGKSRSFSEGNSPAAVNQDVPNFVTPFKTSFGTQLRCEPNISSNEDKNNENQASKRVCYTSNFIRKDLCNDNVLFKSETKRFVQSKLPFSLGKPTIIDRRSKSLENRSNNKPGGKFRMNAPCSKSETMCSKFRAGCALRELSHYQEENEKTDLFEQKRNAESVLTSMSRTTKNRLSDENVSQNNTSRKNTSEVHSHIDSGEKLDALNLFNSERNSSLEELKEETKTRATQSKSKVYARFFLNSDPKYIVTKSNYITSKRCKQDESLEANSLFDLRGKTEKQVFSQLPPDSLTRSIGGQIVHAQKTDMSITNTFSSNTALQNKRTDEMNAVICDICSERFSSHYYLIKHQQLFCRKRPYTSNNFKRNGAFRDQLKGHETYPLCNMRTNRPLHQRWRVAPDNNGGFRWKRNGRQSFYRRTGLRNNGNGAPSRLNEYLQNRKSKRCNTCGKWFTNKFQFSRHFRKGCNSFQVIPKPPDFLYMNISSI